MLTTGGAHPEGAAVSDQSGVDAVDVTTLVEGTLVTMDPERRVIPDGSVAVAGDRIADIGSAARSGRSTPTPSGSAASGAT